METGIVLSFVAGGTLLIGGAELLVRGASRLALGAGLSPLVIGLTVVAFGTSAPELAVTVGAALTGEADVAVGNVVGSNILNVLFILGLSALIVPLTVAQQLVRQDVPLMIAASVLVLLLALDHRVGLTDGVLLCASGVAYTAFLIRQSRKEQPEVAAEYAEALSGLRRRPHRATLNVGMVMTGLAFLTLGARWLVAASVAAATALGVNELVIGLTVVAAGTSLPEIATSVLAAARGERDIAVGNVVGSCIFNLLAVLGVGALTAPEGLAVSPGALTFDVPVMIAVAVAALPIFFTGYTIARWEGAVFLGYYIAYTVSLALDATQHAAATAFTAAMVRFVMPLTALTLVVITVRAVRGRRPRTDDDMSRGAVTRR
ncbi:MAG: calcium/sodium antiporter [Vicinamibacterales bacterium]